MSDEPNFTPQELRDLGLPTYADLRKIADEFHWLASQRGDLLAKREYELDEARAKIAELEAPVEPVPADCDNFVNVTCAKCGVPVIHVDETQYFLKNTGAK
jgi:hypothetical protein